MPSITPAKDGTMAKDISSGDQSAFLAKLEALFDPDTLFTRPQLSEMAKRANIPVAESSLASMASRGTGPTFTKYGSRALYRWGDFVEWVAGKSTVARSTSEHRAKAAA
jgi:hypothetical protein